MSFKVSTSIFAVPYVCLYNDAGGMCSYSACSDLFCVRTPPADHTTPSLWCLQALNSGFNFISWSQSQLSERLQEKFSYSSMLLFPQIISNSI